MNRCVSPKLKEFTDDCFQNMRREIQSFLSKNSDFNRVWIAVGNWPLVIKILTSEAFRNTDFSRDGPVTFEVSDRAKMAYITLPREELVEFANASEFDDTEDKSSIVFEFEEFLILKTELKRTVELQTIDLERSFREFFAHSFYKCVLLPISTIREAQALTVAGKYMSPNINRSIALEIRKFLCGERKK